jgi:hypothetical protein
MGEPPRVTFGMIVLNGMPFLPYNLRSLYPFAHEIVVVEGAAPGAREIATPDGHSRDGTLAELRRFAREDDPLGKVVIVTAEDEGHPNGFWPGEKDEQSRAYAKRAGGDYLWQVDVDEFYLPADMRAVIDRLTADPAITAVTFPTVTIWGALWCATDGWHLRRGAGMYHRLFKWGPGYSYTAHRPPTVLDDHGRDVRSLRWLDGRAVAAMGIVMRHYSLLLPSQVREKVEYYANWGLYGDRLSRVRAWRADSYETLRKPYHVHNVYQYPSWLERYAGSHPPEIERMVATVWRAAPGELRPMDDAQKLLRSPVYLFGRALLKAAEPFDRRVRRWRWTVGPLVRRAVARLRERGARA